MCALIVGAFYKRFRGWPMFARSVEREALKAGLDLDSGGVPLVGSANFLWGVRRVVVELSVSSVRASFRPWGGRAGGRAGGSPAEVL